MQAFLLKLIEKNIPSFLTIPLCIAAATWYVGDMVQTGINDMKINLITEARQPFYLTTEYALAKQLEKLEKDPADLKTTDIELYSILCHEDFGAEYVPTLPANRRLDAEETCKQLTDMYTSRQH